MPDMTMTQAAEWAGVTRATIHKAIKSGRLSAEKDAGGVYRINPAELERAYQPKPVNVSEDSRESRTDTVKLIAAKDREIALYRQLAERADATAADLRAERDKLLGIVETTTRLLTHDRSEAAPETPAQLPAAIETQIAQPAPHGVRARLASWIGRRG